MNRQSIAAFAALGVAVMAMTAVAAGTYDSAAAPSLSTLTFPSFQAADAAATAASPPDWHVSLLERPAALPAADYVSVPLMAAPVCAAYNTTQRVTLQVSLESLGQILLGAGSVRISAPTSAAMYASAVRFVLAPLQASPSCRVLLAALVRQGVAGFTNASSWPAAVAASARVTMVADEAAARLAAKQSTGVVAFFPVAFGGGLPCMKFVVADPYTLDERTYRPYLPSDVARTLAVDVVEPPSVVTGHNAYPLVGPLLLSVRRTASCAAASEAHALAKRVAASPSFIAGLLTWGFGRLSDLSSLEAIRQLVAKSPCTNLTVVPAGGSSAIEGAAASWALQYLYDTDRLIAYIPDASGAGKSGVIANERLIAGSDSLLSEQQRLDFPAIVTVPAIAFAVSLVFNLDGVDRLILPRCAVVRIFNGTLTRWDDPELQRANPAVVLPAEPIHVAVRGTRSGTTDVFTTGLRALDEACNGARATIVITEVWSLPAAISTSSTGAMLRAIKSTVGAIGYSAAGAARDLLMTEASVLDAATGSVTEPTANFVQAALSKGTVAEDGALSFPRGADSYPFVGVTNFVVNRNRRGNCSGTLAALMGPALDFHHELMRQLVAKHNGYEVKTIGDSFMVVFRAARDAVDFALDVQASFMAAEWAPAIDEAYKEQMYEFVAAGHGETGVLKQIRAQLETPGVYPTLWNGIRVRVGVHFDRGSIKLDPVTQAYDYYGTVVNTAARVESVAHGGQVAVTSAAFSAAFPDGAPAGGVAVAEDLGLTELRGLPEPVDLLQLLPAALQGRVFPALRLDKAEALEELTNETSDTESTLMPRSNRSSRSSYRTAYTIEALAASLCPPASAFGAMELLRVHGYTTALLRPLKADDRKTIFSNLKKVWRIQDDAGKNRAFATALGKDKVASLMLAHRAYTSWYTTSGAMDSAAVDHHVTPSGGTALALGGARSIRYRAGNASPKSDRSSKAASPALTPRASNGWDSGTFLPGADEDF